MNLIAEVKAPYYGDREKWVDSKDQNVDGIIEAIKKSHSLDKTDYESFAKTFWRGNARDTAKLLFDFEKKYIVYAVEPELDQTVKSPGRIKADRHGDCKHYALFTCGVCDALNRMGYPVESWYRFTADIPGTEVHHVFAVVSDGKKQWWVDPVIDYFDQRPTFYNTKDVRMAISRLSGTEMSGTIRYDIAIVAGRNPFRTRDHLLRFLELHGKRPADFPDAHSMKAFIIHALNPRMGGMESAIGKKKRHNNFLKSIAHGMEVNLHNAGKEIAKDAKAVKNMALKVSFAAARGPFLALVALNKLNLAHRYRDTLVGPHRTPLLRAWRDIGGNEHAFINAVNSGWRHYKQQHGGYNASRDHISGIGYVGDCSIGFAIESAMALATGIIAVLNKFVHSNAPAADQELAEGAKKGAVDVAMAANEGMQNDKGGGTTTTTDIPGSGGKMQLATGIDQEGNPTVAVRTTSHPAFDQAAQPPAGSSSDDIQGGGAVQLQRQDSNIDTGMAGKDSFKQWWDNATAWVKEHKALAIGVPLAIGTGAVLVNRLGGKKRRR